MYCESVARIGLLTLLLSVFFGCSQPAPISPPPLVPVVSVPTTVVVKVHDGATIIVLYQSASQRLRLAGIDCPESDQPYGAEATEATKTLALNKEVTVIPITTDRFGRTVANVNLPDGRSLSHELVKVGACWWFRKYAANDVELKELEREARTQRLGLWATESPVSPWEWRAQGQNATKRSLQN